VNKYISGVYTGALALDRTFGISQDFGSEQLYGELGEFEGG